MNAFLKISAAALALSALAAVPALAEDYTIEMKNRGEAGPMVFEPALLEIQPGDTVTFLATDRAHNAETIDGLIPEGAEPFKGAMNEEITVTFDVEGAYAIKCRPHYAMGMVALIVVGDDPTNLADIQDASFPRKSQQRFDAMFEELAAE